MAERIALREFARWASPAVGIADPDVAVADLTTVFTHTRRAGVDLTDPLAVDDAIEVIFEDADEDDVDILLEALHDYLHFRLDTTGGSEWEDAHDRFEEEFADEGPDGILSTALAEGLAVDADERRHAVAKTKIVAAVPDLIAWLGSGRAVTGTGAVRRSDIEPFAALLGIRARGVATLPPYTGAESDVIEVQSMWDAPALDAWWEALRAAELIEVGATRVWAGPAAWPADELAPLDTAEMVAGVFVGQLVSAAVGDGDVWGVGRLRAVVAAAMQALDPDTVAEPGPFDDLFRPRAERTMAHLEAAGLLAPDGTGGWIVPEALRASFARGLMLALTLAAPELGAVDDDEADARWGDDGDDSAAELFADPDVRAEMARFGVVHQPGLAAQMLGELAPLLAADGIDLDNLENVDLDDMNAALARATERHNLRLFTPVGGERRRALAVLRLATEALTGGDAALATAIVGGVPSDPTDELASVAQVMGAGLGILDEWHSDPRLRVALRDVSVPGGGAGASGAGGASAFGAAARGRGAFGRPSGLSAAAVPDILRLARRGGSFDGMGELHRSHAGPALLAGIVLAVAGSAVARADHEGVSVADLVARELQE